MPEAVTTGTRRSPGEAAKGAAWLTLEMVAVQAISLLVFAVLARFLSAADFGLVSICFVLVQSCRTVLFDNITVAVTRKAHGTDTEYATAFWLTVGISAACFLGVEALALRADALFAIPGLGQVLHGMGVIVLVQGLSRTQEQWMSRHFFFPRPGGPVPGRLRARRRRRGGRGRWPGSAYGRWSCSRWRWPWSAWRRCGSCAPGGRPSRSRAEAARAILLFCRGLMGSSLTYTLNQNCDTLLIGFVFGPTSVGVYSVAKRLTLALTMVAATPAKTVAVPLLAELQADPARLGPMMLTTTAVIAAVCAPLFLGAAAVAPDAVALTFGPGWGTVGPVFAWLAAGGLATVLLEHANSVFVVAGRPAWTFYTGALNVLLIVPVFVLFGQGAGPWLALPFVLPGLALVPGAYALVARLAGVGPWRCLQQAALPTGAALAMVATVLLAAPHLRHLVLPARLAAEVGLGALVYVAALALVSRRSFTMVRGLVRRRALRTVP